jgi:hypothetical protein
MDARVSQSYLGAEWIRQVFSKPPKRKTIREDVFFIVFPYLDLLQMESHFLDPESQFDELLADRVGFIPRSRSRRFDGNCPFRKLRVVQRVVVFRFRAFLALFHLVRLENVVSFGEIPLGK